MKTLTEIVNRIKKKKVSGAEKSALQTSVAEFTEKNRGKLPQKVAGLLALTMLTSMLASCDEFGFGEISGTLDGTETSEIQINPDEIYNNGISELYGLTGIFSEMNFKEMIMNTSNDNYNYVMSAYNEVVKRLEESETFMARDWGLQERNSMFIGSILSGENGNVIINVDTDGWKHKIIMTENDFFMISEDTNISEFYLTGFCGNEFFSDLGMPYDESKELVNKMLKESDCYDILVQRLKGEFCGALLKGASCLGNGNGVKYYLVDFGGSLPIKEDGEYLSSAALTSMSINDRNNCCTLLKPSVETDVEPAKIIELVKSVQQHSDVWNDMFVGETFENAESTAEPEERDKKET